MVKTGPELMAEIASYPSLDLLLDRDPRAQPITDEELEALILRQRADRALFELRAQEKRDKKRGQEALAPTEEEKDNE